MPRQWPKYRRQRVGVVNGEAALLIGRGPTELVAQGSVEVDPALRHGLSYLIDDVNDEVLALPQNDP